MFDYLETAAWIVSLQSGELPACEADLDVMLNDACPRCAGQQGAGDGLPCLRTTSGRRAAPGRYIDTDCGKERATVMPGYYRCRMTSFAHLGKPPQWLW